MIGSLTELRDATASLLAQLEPRTMTPDEAASATELLAETGRAIAGSKALCAARASESTVWKQAGDRSAAHWLARLDGSSVARGGICLDAAKAAAENSRLGDAIRSGNVSLDAAGEIASVGRYAPSQVEPMLDMSADCSLAELRNRAREIRARSRGPREAEARDRARRARYARRQADGDGAARLVLGSSVEDIALLEAAAQPYREAAFELARQEGRHEPAEALAFDAYALALRSALAEAAPESEEQTLEPAEPGATPIHHDHNDDRPLALPHSAPSRVWVCDHSALSRGFGVVDERCELSGVGPVPVASVVEILDSGAAIGVVTTSASGSVQRVARIARAPGTSPGHRLRNYRRRGSRRFAPPLWLNDEVIIHVPETSIPSSIEDCDRFQRAVVDRGVDVAELIHHGRQATAAQRLALTFRDPTCRVKGCTATAHLEIDHQIEWARTRHTTLTELGRLCTFHHRLRSRYGYELEPGPGKRRLLPPERIKLRNDSDAEAHQGEPASINKTDGEREHVPLAA